MRWMTGALLLTTAACGGAATTNGGAATPEVPRGNEEPVAPSLGNVTVAKGDTASSGDALVAAARSASLVCIGEQHDDGKHHRLQAALTDAVAGQDGRELAVGMEMFQRPFQGVLDKFNAGSIGIPELVADTEWDKRWGFAFSLYRPIFDVVKAQKLPLLALNAERDVTKRVARGGLDALPEEVRAQLPELDLSDAGHKKFFFAAMGFEAPPGGDNPHGANPHGATPHGANPHGANPHGANPHHGGGGVHGGIKPEWLYTAQVIWDETMAEAAASWLTTSKRQVVVIAGNGHCHKTAIPKRVARRIDGASVLSILVRTGKGELPPHAESDYVVTVMP